MERPEAMDVNDIIWAARQRPNQTALRFGEAVARRGLVKHRDVQALMDFLFEVCPHLNTPLIKGKMVLAAAEAHRRNGVVLPGARAPRLRREPKTKERE